MVSSGATKATGAPLGTDPLDLDLREIADRVLAGADAHSTRQVLV
jgi:hypothetical protein